VYVQPEIQSNEEYSLLVEKLLQVLDEADDNDDCRTKKPNEKEDGKQVHSEKAESAHESIVPLLAILPARGKC
jgi:hypothetical protein